MAKKVTVEPKKTLEQLEKEHEALTITLEQYLLVIGVEYSMIDAVIRDLKDQIIFKGNYRTGGYYIKKQKRQNTN